MKALRRYKQQLKASIAMILMLMNLLVGFPIDPILNWLEPILIEKGLQIALPRVINPTQAAVNHAAVVGFGETAADDNMQFLNYASTSVWTDRGDSVDTTTNTNDIFHVRMKTAPTRNEIMAGQIEHAVAGAGTLHVTRCVGGCDASADWTEELEIANVSAAQSCDGTAGACDRTFDIAYEQLSGRAFVAYTKTANDGILYYNIWNGSSWVGESSYTYVTPSTNDGKRVRLVAEGEGLENRRSNRILILVADAGNRLYGAIWDGSSVTSTTTIDSTLSSVNAREPFDGAWESLSGNAVVVYGDTSGTGTSTTPYNYKRFIHSTSTWDASGQGSLVTLAAAGSPTWMSLRSHNGSNRMAATAQNSGRAVPLIWKADGTTEGWTAGTQDTSLETNLNPNIVVAWEKTNGGTPFAIFVTTDASANDQSDYTTWTQSGGFTTADIPGNMGDDAAQWKLYSSSNTDEIHAIGVEFSDDMCFTRWSGTTWDSTCTTEYSTTLPPDTATAHNEGSPFDMTYQYYSTWSRNWRWYSDVTSDTPSTGYGGAAENEGALDVPVDGLIRLRMQAIELGGVLAQTDTRKKLQYTSGCNPNTTNEGECTWADVGDVTETSAVWRYTSQANGDAVCSSCNDNTAITGSLTGTTQNGTYITDKDAAGGTNMDHNASAVVEYDFPLKAEAAGHSTTYYFRMVDVDGANTLQINPRRQDSGTTDCLGTTCTYPSVIIAAPDSTFTLSNYRWYIDNDSENVTDPWGLVDLAENALITQFPATVGAPGPTTELRLRTAITVGTSDLLDNTHQFKLQYKAGTDGSCTTGSWTDVGAGGSGDIWRMATSSVADGTALSVLKLAASDVAQVYVKNNPSALNPNSTTNGQDMEYDFHIEHNGALDNTTYSFRLIESEGTVFTAYTNCPTLTTYPGPGDVMRHGLIFTNNAEQGFIWAN